MDVQKLVTPKFFSDEYTASFCVGFQDMLKGNVRKSFSCNCNRLAMKRTIAQVSPNNVHRLYQCHIMRNARDIWIIYWNLSFQTNKVLFGDCIYCVVEIFYHK